MNSPVSRLLDFVLEAENRKKQKQSGGWTLSDEELRKINPTGLGILTAKWGGPVTNVLVLALDDTNPQRLRTRAWAGEILPDAGGMEEDRAKHYSSQIFNLFDKNKLKPVKSKKYSNRKTRIDIDLSQYYPKKDWIIFLHCMQHNNPKHSTSFLKGESESIVSGNICEKTLFSYNNSSGKEILSQPRWVVNDDPNWIMSYCKKTNPAADQSYAIGLSVYDYDVTTGEPHYQTDIIIDPKVRNDG